MKIAVVEKETLINISSESQSLRLTNRKHIPTDDILYMESEVNYTNVYTSDNRKHISSFTLKKLEARILEKDFHRINRGCLVNLNHITQITGLKRNAQAKLSNGSVLTISRRKFEKITGKIPHVVVVFEE